MISRVLHLELMALVSANLACLGVLARAQDTFPTRGDDGALAWVNEAQQLALDLEDEDEQYAVWLRIGVFHGKRDDFVRAHAATQRIREVERRSVALTIIAGEIAEFRNGAAAVRFARQIQSEAVRDRALMHIVLAQAAKHRFSEAETTIASMSEWGTKWNALYALAVEQAKAGEFDGARETAGKLPTVGWTNSQRYSGLLKFIAEQKKEGRRDKPAQFPIGVLQAIRELGGGYAEPSRLDAESMRATLQELDSPFQKACAWQYIAYAHYADKQRGKCRQALDRATTVAKQISDSYAKLLVYVRIADLMLQCENRQGADQLLKEALRTGLPNSILESSDTSALGPKIVSVLVRLGKIGEAFGIAESVNARYQEETWWALGASCALLERITDVDRRLPQVKSNERKALLCVGVASGLQEASQETDQNDQ